MEYLLILSALSLAFSNGANDNFKGLATIWGSKTLSYRQALVLAMLATVAGSLASLFLAGELVQQFSGMFLRPLLLSPLLAAALGFVANRLLRLRPVDLDCACVVAPTLTAPRN
ncbi:hypothetical protein TPL01_31170 [Sulfuriferula plumbiphila]|uniref:Inorganic phosphate transporter n=2 Tax=Sulfuriferula plumbiphila TaxID=171865 RepID=A0A512LBV1_9PROT|nr:hypothetical protein SFPGR_28370 [Sulfuriferula plumbiphila]GEP31979.1 hypothetical protein TPL01_31170 [Sulfuriferula plumbiphila]